MTERAVNSDCYSTLTIPDRQQVDAIVGVLINTGGYHGSASDAQTDAVTIIRAAQFAPPNGDNHHNALACPYCSPPTTKEGDRHADIG